jgi:hypothetical protein
LLLFLKKMECNASCNGCISATVATLATQGCCLQEDSQELLKLDHYRVGGMQCCGEKTAPNGGFSRSALLGRAIKQVGSQVQSSLS